MSSQLRTWLDESRATLKHEEEALGNEAFCKQRVHQMAQNGDLAFIEGVMGNMLQHYSMTILSETMDPKVHLARGALAGLREFWTGLLELGSDQDDDEETRVHEKNPFAILPDGF